MREKNIIAIFLLLFVPFNIQANVYYVAVNGIDTNTGTEILPWKTIQKAANTLIAGDTVLIKSGIYNERIIVQNSGAHNNFIVFSNFENDNVTIDGNGISWGSAWNGLFDVSNKSYILINGLKIINADYGGIWVENSDHITIKDNYTYNSFSSGIGVWYSSYVTIENNEIELACNDGEQECITVAHSNHCEIFNNDVHHNGSGANGGEGIDVKQGSHDVNIFKNIVHHLNERIGIYVDAWDEHTYNINIYQNIVHDCGNNGMVVQSEMGGTVEYVTFFNNIVYRNKWDGIAVGSVTASDTVSSTPVKHIQIINNTLYKNGEILDGWGYGILIDNPDATDVIVRNNICSENSAQIAIQQIASGGVVDHNLFFGDNVASGTLYGNDSIIGNPLFIDDVLFDFHLQNNSPAIDNGSSVDAPILDFANTIRPYGGSMDIGAYEFNPILNVQNNLITKDFIKIYPNPFSDKLTIKIDNQILQKYTLLLFDINGKLLRKEIINQVKGDLIIINRDGLVSGFYFLNLLVDNNVVINKKLIIE